MVRLIHQLAQAQDVAANVTIIDVPLEGAPQLTQLAISEKITFLCLKINQSLAQSYFVDLR